MIALAALAAALVSAGEPGAGEEPASQALPAAVRAEAPPPEHPPSAAVRAPPPPAGPPADPAPPYAALAAPPSAPSVPARPAGPEWSVFAGWLDTRLMGVAVQSLQLRAARGFPGGPRSSMQLAADVFAGETRPGLPVRGGSVGVEAWLDPAGRVRAGLGAGVAAVAYRRFATRGEWPSLLTAGLRAGVEIDVLRLSAGTIVLGGHGSAYLGPWFSGSVSAGFRGGGAPHTAR